MPLTCQRVVPVEPTGAVRSCKDQGGRPGLGPAPIFPAPRDIGQPISRDALAVFLRRAEKAAGLPRLPQDSFHGLRRKWVSERKHLPDVDVAKACGWRSISTMKRSYQLADEAGRARGRDGITEAEGPWSLDRGMTSLGLGTKLQALAVADYQLFPTGSPGQLGPEQQKGAVLLPSSPFTSGSPLAPAPAAAPWCRRRVARNGYPPSSTPGPPSSPHRRGWRLRGAGPASDRHPVGRASAGR